jgi:hypothetical protein
LLALAYPAITKSRPKNASNLIHTVGIWTKVRLPNSWAHHPGDMPEGILRAILKQAGIEPDVFLQKK